MIKKIILCADDYGQNDAISDAIIKLIAKQRLSATSCMATSICWSENAKKLLPFLDRVDVGLHFNLTDKTPLFKLIVSAYLRQLNQQVIEQEFNRQLDNFVAVMGRLPDFIDGHQHVHQLPIIRDAILNVYDQRLRQNNVYVRCVKLKNNCAFKKLIIGLLGSGALKKKLQQFSIPYNHSFSGIYAFSNAINYAKTFPGFLKEVDDGGLIMCHPGLESNDAKDEIAYGRKFEYEYLMSDKFLEDCEFAKVKILCFKSL